jgi:hypothetical protein
LSTAPIESVFRRHGWDFAAAVLLLYAAYLLGHAANHYYSYSRFGYGWMRYEEGSYFERLRLVVCAAWMVAAFRYYNFKWSPVSVLGVAIAWLYNPILPVTMNRFRWQPYDHWTMLASIAAAIVLGVMSIRHQQTEAARTTRASRT